MNIVRVVAMRSGGLQTRSIDYSLSAQARFSALFKALTHPARVAILDHLRHGKQCVCHLEANLGFRQAYISQQLAVLRDAGIIQDERDGLNIYYRVTCPEIFVLIDAARAISGLSDSQYLAAELPTPCPCPRCAARVL
jgi:DNA-binding transcriptional ArsR family regulator